MSRRRVSLSSGGELSFITAGDASGPAVLLLHGTPNTSRMFRDLIPALAQVAHVIAPDMPGFGESDPLPAVSLAARGQSIAELLDRLAIGPRFVYLHDWGTPVGLHIAMQAPERVLGLIVQNANAHRSGWGPGWAATREYWANPNPQNEAAATRAPDAGRHARYLPRRRAVGRDRAHSRAALAGRLAADEPAGLETHAATAAPLMVDFIRRTSAGAWRRPGDAEPGLARGPAGRERPGTEFAKGLRPGVGGPVR